MGKRAQPVQRVKPVSRGQRKNRCWEMLAKLPFGVYLVLGVLCVAGCAVGMLLFLITAGGEIHGEFRTAQDAVAVRGVNGLAVDSAGNLYEGTDGSASIQVFDCDGKFLYRLCIPSYKAVSGSFFWSLDGRDRLTVYTYRDDDRLVIENRQVTERTHYETQAAFEAAVTASGHTLYAGGAPAFTRDGRCYEASLFGKVRSWQAETPGEVTTVSLEVPHFPPPVFVCWGITAVSLLGALALFGIAVRVDELRQSKARLQEQ